MNTTEITDKLQDWKRRATDTARHVGAATDRCVHENAWTSIAFAAVVGCIIGYLMSYRRD
jgi:ElaB/YqjD/DUF883 family membrane-anchored ribosome-binding protein